MSPGTENGRSNRKVPAESSSLFFNWLLVITFNEGNLELCAFLGHDVVARYGGEGFLIIFDAATLDTAQELAERIRVRIMADPFCEDSVSLWMTTSFGVAQARAGDSVETLTSRADQAMYLAKKGGRNQVRTELELPDTEETAIEA